ncbi:hypothetical protein BX070DRAFT_228424 [Coemansia spiralis]|nr:hypothetical protein BX070DRAFT_228424 [Coemansia spiralis]
MLIGSGDISNLNYVENVWIVIGRSQLHEADLGLQQFDGMCPSSCIFPTARRIKI